MERWDDTDEAPREDVTVVRSEEELVTRRERRAVERVRVRKVVVEEERMVPVVVRREELRVEREAIADGDAGDDPRAEAPELVAELVLHSEEIEVVTRVVPRERVRILRVREVAEQEVTAELRRERIEVEEAGRS